MSSSDDRVNKHEAIHHHVVVKLPSFAVDYKGFQELIDTASSLLENESHLAGSQKGRLIELSASGEIIIIGDLHGDFRSMKRVLKETRFIKRASKNEDITLVSLGDYIDRGPKQIEVMYTMLNLFILYPGKVVLLRGNHEGPRDLEVHPHDFPLKLREKYDTFNQIYESLRDLFDRMHTAVRIENKALLLHGGIPTQASSLDDVAYAHLNHPHKSHLTEILWNDPSTLEGVRPSPRGSGRLFSLDVARRFLDDIEVEMVIRGHEPYDDGFHFHDSRILTLFSCKIPPYNNRYGAYLQAPMDESFTRNSLTEYIRTF